MAPLLTRLELYGSCLIFPNGSETPPRGSSSLAEVSFPLLEGLGIDESAMTITDLHSVLSRTPHILSLTVTPPHPLLTVSQSATPDKFLRNIFYPTQVITSPTYAQMFLEALDKPSLFNLSLNVKTLPTGPNLSFLTNIDIESLSLQAHEDGSYFTNCDGSSLPQVKRLWLEPSEKSYSVQELMVCIHSNSV